MTTIKRKPTHPGEILKEDYLEPLSISITQLAKALGVSRKTLSKIVNEKASITPEMALKLSRVFDTTPELWLNLQNNYDLWYIAKKSKSWRKIKPIIEPLTSSSS